MAIFAVLLQAVLFGWHSHPLRFAAGAAPGAVFQNNPDQPLPDADDDGCEICAALHHQSLAGGPAPVAPGRPAAEAEPTATAPILVRPEIIPAFWARGPPLV